MRENLPWMPACEGLHRAYGRTTGGVLTVVTKTGTNTFEGSAYEFYRDKSLNSESESEKLGGSGKTPYRRIAESGTTTKRMKRYTPIPNAGPARNGFCNTGGKSLVNP